MTITTETPRTVAARYHNAAQWLHDLGDIPLERILFDPPPGTATEADFLRKVEVEKQRCELVDGTLVEKPMGAYESLLAFLLGHKLLEFVIPRRLGAVMGADGPLRFRVGLVRLPDVAFISSKQLRSRGGIREPIPSLIPELVIEIMSPGNRPGEMRRKLDEYFTAGVRLVWLIDPSKRSARVYRARDKVRHVKPGGFLSGENLLSGFEIQLSELFKEADQMAEGAE